MKSKKILNQKGQGLIEYLIIVAIVAVGSIAVIKVVGGNINVTLAKVAKSLSGEAAGDIKHHEVTDGLYKKKDLGNFFQGAANRAESSK